MQNMTEKNPTNDTFRIESGYEVPKADEQNRIRLPGTNRTDRAILIANADAAAETLRHLGFERGAGTLAGIRSGSDWHRTNPETGEFETVRVEVAGWNVPTWDDGRCWAFSIIPTMEHAEGWMAWRERMISTIDEQEFVEMLEGCDPFNYVPRS